VNHLHWHMYYLNHDLNIEEAVANGNLLEDWPVKGFVWDIEDFSVTAIDKCVGNVFKLIDYCFETELPHNLFITRNRTGSAIRVFLWTREAAFGTKDDMQIIAAFCEFSGFYICKTDESYQQLTEEFCVALMGSLNTNFDLVRKQLNSG